MGYSRDKRNYLHAEELLYVIEQGKAVLTSDGTENTGMSRLIIVDYWKRS